MQPAVERFLKAAESLNLDLKIIEHEESTRTAEEAAAAVGCTVGQIVKSLCFSVNDEPVMALISGDNQLDTKKLAQLIGVGRKKVKRAPVDLVREATGFAIGGVPPFGHVQQMTTYIDQHLTDFDEIWAAAGTPKAVFSTTAMQLETATGGIIADLKAD